MRYLQTLNSISAENNSTIIFPVIIIIPSSYYHQFIIVHHHVITSTSSYHHLMIIRSRSTSCHSWWTIPHIQVPIRFQDEILQRFLKSWWWWRKWITAAVLFDFPPNLMNKFNFILCSCRMYDDSVNMLWIGRLSKDEKSWEVHE